VEDEKLKFAARSLWLRRRALPSQPKLNESRVAAEGEFQISIGNSWRLSTDPISGLVVLSESSPNEFDLALQLPTCFEMRTLSGGLVSSAPE
jgi:hypothetical protein